MVGSQKMITYKQAMQYLGITSYNTFKYNYLDRGLPIMAWAIVSGLIELI